MAPPSLGGFHRIGGKINRREPEFKVGSGKGHGGQPHGGSEKNPELWLGGGCFRYIIGEKGRGNQQSRHWS